MNTGTSGTVGFLQLQTGRSSSSASCQIQDVRTTFQYAKYSMGFVLKYLQNWVIERGILIPR